MESSASDEGVPQRKDMAYNDGAHIRVSVWTIIGSIAASVIATAIIGGAAGLLQVPTIARDVDSIKTAREASSVQYQSLSERVRSNELVADATTRRINDTAMLLAAADARRERLAEIETKFEQMYVYEHAALEGRSKDRHTEAMGAIAGLKSSDLATKDRIDALNMAIAQLRTTLFDFVMRGPRNGQAPALLQHDGMLFNASHRSKE